MRSGLSGTFLSHKKRERERERERERILFLFGCTSTTNPLVPSVKGRGRLAQLWHIFLWAQSMFFILIAKELLNHIIFFYYFFYWRLHWMMIIVTIPWVHMQLSGNRCWIHLPITIYKSFLFWIQCIWWSFFANRAVWSILQTLHAGKTKKILTRFSSACCGDMHEKVKLAPNFEIGIWRWTLLEGIVLYCGICGNLYYYHILVL